MTVDGTLIRIDRCHATGPTARSDRTDARVNLWWSGNYQPPVPPALAVVHEAERQTHSAQRIRVEHGISHLPTRRALSRHLGRREHLDTILPAIAGRVFAQERTPRPEQLRCPPRALPAGTAR